MMQLKELSVGRLKLVVVQGDITKIKADAIVNAANKYLSHGGGVAYAIAKAAAGDAHEYTKLSQKAMLDQIGRRYIEHGEVVITPSLSLGRNGVKYVIHTVGPRCNGRWDASLKLKLKNAILGPLRKADALHLVSIAFPAISAGIYGCDLRHVIATFFDALRDFEAEAKSLSEVFLVLYSKEDAEIALATLEALHRSATHEM